MSVSDTAYEIVFAGGGTTACVIAGRLAAADPSLKILVLEAGPQTRDVADHIQPARYFRHLMSPDPRVTYHVAKPSQAVAGRSVTPRTGRCLGGGSSINYMMYTRASASDYDDWEFRYDNPGWGSKHLIPLIKKAETYQRATPGDRATHGTSGPIKVSVAEEFNIGSEFLAVAAEYDKERGLTDDANDFFTCNAYGKWPRYIDLQSGRRSDTAHHYIYNQSHNENLKIMERSRVVRVIFEGNRAVGVEYVDDTVGRSKDGIAETFFVQASRMVVISAGAFGSPAILERSGIGGTDVMQRNDISQIVALPGVGENCLDHYWISSPFFASEDADTLDVIFRDEEGQLEPFVSQWLLNGNGPMALSGIDAGIKMRPNAEDLKEIGPMFDARWKTYFADAPDKPVVWINPLAAYGGTDPTAPRRKYFTLGYFSAYPLCIGRVHINSGSDTYAPLDFESGFLSDPSDVDVLRWMYKKGREIARRMASYRGELECGHPPFPKGSQATCNSVPGPVDVLSPDIFYSTEDNEAIDNYHRATVASASHSLGTCAMKPRDQGGVVDPRLNVYGTLNLKVADCSIAPANVAANTYNTALAIGEKAAVIIAEDLGIKGLERI